MEVWVVYNIATSIVDSIHPDQTDATSKATPPGGEPVTLRAHTAAIEWPIGFQPGLAYFDTATSEVVIEKPERIPSEHPLKVAALSLYKAGVGLEDIGHGLSRGFPEEAGRKFHDFLFRLRQYHYLLMHSTTITQANKIRWAKTVPAGPADIPVQNGDVRDAVLRFYRAASSLTVPTGPASWVDPATGTAVNLADEVTLTGTIPDTVDLSNGGWIENLLTNLNYLDTASIKIGVRLVTPTIT